MLRSFLLLTLLVLPSGAFAQTVQAGLSYDEGAAQLVIHARTTGDLSGEALTGAIVTLRYPSGETTELGAVTSAFGFSQQGGLAAAGGFTYAAYTANPVDATLTGLDADGAEIELLRIALVEGAGTSNTVELAPRNTAPQLGGPDEFTFETDHVNFRDDFGDPYFAAQTTLQTSLPIELAVFAALPSGEDRITLTWSTASESGNAGFHVQRQAVPAASDDAAGEPLWETLAWVEGQGTTTQPQAYRFEDTALPFEAATVRYRLQQVDHDGAFAYSPEVEVAPGPPEAFALLPVFPNPFREAATIHYTLRTAGHVRLTLYDLLGRAQLHLFDGEQPAGRHRLTLDGTALASGLYYLRVKAGTFTATRSLMRIR